MEVSYLYKYTPRDQVHPPEQSSQGWYLLFSLNISRCINGTLSELLKVLWKLHWDQSYRTIITARKRSYVFTAACDSVHRRGRGWYPNMPCRWYPSMPCSRSPGGWYPSMSCRFPGPHLGESWGQSGQGGSPGPQWRGSWGESGQGGVSRPTTKGEVEGDLAWEGLQAHTWGVCSGGCLLWGCLLLGVGLLPGRVCSWGVWRPPSDGYCCGRYASYWNAFLFHITVRNTTPDKFFPVLTK